ncbi:MAG: DsbA family protein [bacterium]
MKQTIAQYLMVLLLVAGAYFLGVYKTKTEYLTKAPSVTQEVAGAQAQPTPRPIEMAKVDELFNDKSNLVFGDPGAKLKFVEFSDTSCPYCQVASGKNPELNKQISPNFVAVKDGGKYVPPELEIRKLVEDGKAAMIWLYTPGHGNGELGTLALYCANEQGKFWQTHDLLMSNKGYIFLNETVKNDRTKFAEVASFLKSAADATKMKTCFESGRYEPRVTGDPQIAQGFGYGATPTFFINDKVVEGAANWTEGFKPFVDPYL